MALCFGFFVFRDGEWRFFAERTHLSSHSNFSRVGVRIISNVRTRLVVGKGTFIILYIFPVWPYVLRGMLVGHASHAREF